jgi:hypothetical protein
LSFWGVSKREIKPQRHEDTKKSKDNSLASRSLVSWWFDFPSEEAIQSARAGAPKTGIPRQEPGNEMNHIRQRQRGCRGRPLCLPATHSVRGLRRRVSSSFWRAQGLLPSCLIPAVTHHSGGHRDPRRTLVCLPGLHSLNEPHLGDARHLFEFLH